MRAIHLEVTTNLTTDSFIMALMRFIGRRGYPREIFSDNGTNLVGARREIENCLRDRKQDRIHEKLLVKGIDWHFRPPAASHWGGVWERMVRSVRRVLNALAHEQTLTDESLMTFMIEAERIVNNRPLIPITADSQDLEVLTPAKLLLLRENVTNFSDLPLSNKYSRRWQQASYLAKVFWKRWSREYVSLLQQRHKWTKLERNLREGDLVVICSDFREKDKWPLGLVQRAILGKDGQVRQVELRTGNGIFVRDIRKVCLLEAVDRCDGP
uniref:SJCHGC03504 protein n=1 Tax=Schistosoma japonicum TaxID=6182 RepID=Q5DAZ4_SCHJA|nr:SJCHGC03504 protein [Schistosoma japonicum]